ncbi:MAG: hypothetical protein RIR97_1297 [Pseudomonadota bacterium]|jgi:ABC-type uncharacterized transport system substrate-binding protein
MASKFHMTVCSAFALFPSFAMAHPHIFAEARLEIVAGADGAVQELRNVWRFDEVFSSSVLLDFDKNSNLKLDPEEATAVGTTVRDSLVDYSYYTSLTSNGKPVSVAKPDVLNVDFKDGQLLMFFSLKPSEPMVLKGNSLTFGVYDPTLYTAIDFPTDGDLVIVGDAFQSCKNQVIRPNPDEVISQNQKTLTDAFFNDPAGTNMTKLFATRMEVTC